MKKKKDNDLVTKGFLKSYLTRKLNQFEKRIEERFDFKMEQRFKEFKNDMIVIKDEIVKEIRDMRKRLVSNTFRHAEFISASLDGSLDPEPSSG